MFWTERLVQRTMFDGDEVQSPTTISQLIKFAQDAFPCADINLHRQIAFLTHKATQNFLGPMLVRSFGSIDQAKAPTMDWLECVGSFETFARSTRHNDSNTAGAPVKKREMPAWYRSYKETDRYTEMKERANAHWSEYMGEITCCVDARHKFEVMHHRDYGRIGHGDEFRFLAPFCHGCHVSFSARGPRLDAVCPEAVKRWL